MQTDLADRYRDTPEGKEADAILRTCVHCGFCLATCPTYRLLGDELDGPRGRIYLVKQVLEGATPSEETRLHLDRCLTCRACETTCPSGVRYGRLADIGRAVVEEQVPRGPAERAARALLRAVLPYSARFAPVLALGRSVRPVLPASLRRRVPRRRDPGRWPAPRHARKMIALGGCVQPSIAPDINAAAARVLDRLGISLVEVPAAGCCGAVSYHLAAQEEGLDFMRSNVDAWWPLVEAGSEAVIATSSACAAMIKEYADLLADDPAYADRAARIASMTRDLSEVVAAEDRAALRTPRGADDAVAFHSPCTLQHGQRITGVVEGILTDAGYRLTPVPDAHICCGSAGTYSILQPRLSSRLLRDKLDALESARPARIATANIGCLAHLETEASVPVTHWIDLLDP